MLPNYKVTPHFMHIWFAWYEPSMFGWMKKPNAATEICTHETTQFPVCGPATLRGSSTKLRKYANAHTF